MSSLMKKVSNPQGKGIVGVTEDLRNFSPLQVQAKNSLQWLADYFTSTLVLGSKYGFKPVVGNEYYLYFKDNDWSLSLVEPHAWRTQKPGIYFAQCVLDHDMTWSVTLKPTWHENSKLVKAISLLEQEFMRSIGNSTAVIDQLPFYLQSLNYYQRVGANALARSLQKSLELTLGKEQSQRFSGSNLLAELSCSSSQKLLEYTS